MNRKNVITSDNVIVISDLHVGDPKSKDLDDFDRDKEFESLLWEVVPNRIGKVATLVIAGDFIDFPQVMPELAMKSPGDKFGASESESWDKICRVIDGHPRVFLAMRKFLDKGNQIVLLPGNHDVDFHWPAVMDRLRETLGGIGEPQFVFLNEGNIDEQKLYIEHGNQYSYDNFFKYWDNPIIESPDGPRLERPWGTLFMDLVYNNVEEIFPFVNKVYPHSRLGRILLRSFDELQEIPSDIIARLVSFFALKGKRRFGERLLGDNEQSREETIDSILESLPGDEENERIEEIALKARTLLNVENDDAAPLRQEPEGLLGRNDERGLHARTRELLESGLVSVVVFGHTHEYVDGNDSPSWGPNDPRRSFNTGTWMPRIEFRDGERPKWSELKSRPFKHDLRFLSIDLSQDEPHATLNILN